MPGVRRLGPLLVVLTMLSSAAPAAVAAWPGDPDVNVPLSAAANDQVSPTIAADGAGGAIVTWFDFRSGTDFDIYAQRVSKAGVPQWSTGGVALCTAVNNQHNPTIVSDGAGGAIVTWYDDRSGTDHDIYAQRVNAAGVPLWNTDGVALCTAANDQYNPTIVSDGAGGAIVTWYDDRSGNYNIYAQRVNAAGVPQWTPDGVELCTAANDRYSPMIVSDGSGGAIVTWYDGRSSTSYDIYAQRVNAAGAPQWTADGVALCTAANIQSYPTIVSDGAGGAIVTWFDRRSGTNTDIYARRVDAAGVPRWTPDGVALCTAANAQAYPMIVSDGAGGAIVTWHDFRSGTDYDIYAQRVSASGVPLWTPDGVALCTAADAQDNPTIASDEADGAIVTWHDFRSGTDYDIYAQRVSASGVPLWTPNGVALCTAAQNQDYPAVISEVGGVIVVWQDYRSGAGSDIYAQDVNADGTLGGSLLSAPSLPITSSFSIRSVRPNPSAGDLSISFSLLDGAPAALELYDLTGRRVESLSVGGLGAGAHVRSLAPRVPALPSGVYFVSLTQGSHRAFSKVAIAR
jgi:hypothetical protein